MSFSTTYTSRDLKRVARVFRKLEKHGTETQPLMDAIGQTLTESAAHRLAVTNEAPDGTPWPQSARARVKGGPTQYDSGMAGLAGSLTHHASARETETGSGLPYAAMRQWGGVIRPKNAPALVFKTFDESGEEILIFAKKVEQPAREYLGISAADEAELGALALDYLADSFGEVRP